MAQISFFAAGYVLLTVGALIALIFSAADSKLPRPAPIVALLVMSLGLAVTTFGTFVG